MTFNKCSINGIIYGDQNDTYYGKSDEMIKVRIYFSNKIVLNTVHI